MSRGRRAPGALVLLAGGAIALAFCTDHPLVLAAIAAGALILFVSAPGRPSRWFLVGGAISGLGLALLNPFVSAEGDLIVWRGPELPAIDTEITVEEVALGIAMGVRLFAVAVLIGAALAHMDADRLQAQVARAAPRSALTCALAARLLPTLERDATALSEAARMRGLDLRAGWWGARARRAAPLALPLLGSGLERGLDVAEAMVARGYASGPRSRVPEASYDAGERIVTVLGALLVALVIMALATPAIDYAYYPTRGVVGAPSAIAVALAGLGCLAGAAAALRRTAAGAVPA
jgi:energy-coupling factor transporter transmembrane protein EcfT